MYGRTFPSAVNMNLDIYQSGHLAHKSFEAGFDASLYCCLLLLRKIRLKSPKNNVFYHITKITSIS